MFIPGYANGLPGVKKYTWNLIRSMCSKITLLKSQPHLPGANDSCSFYVYFVGYYRHRLCSFNCMRPLRRLVNPKHHGVFFSQALSADLQTWFQRPWPCGQDTQGTRCRDSSAPNGRLILPNSHLSRNSSFRNTLSFCHIIPIPQLQVGKGP